LSQKRTQRTTQVNRLELVHNFMGGLGSASTSPDPEKLAALIRDTEHTVKGVYKGRKPSISPSNFGKLTPQEMWLILNDRGDEIENNFSPELKFKMMSGGIIEHAWVLAMREAGIEVDTAPEINPITIHGVTIKGTPDYVIDGKVWDCKTTNVWSYKSKFLDPKALAYNDKYGYLCQGVAYSKMTGLPFGGWDVIETNMFNFKSLDASEIEYEMDCAWEAACSNLEKAVKADTLEEL